MLSWLWQSAVTAYLSYTMIRSFLPRLKLFAYACYVSVAHTFVGRNALRRFEVRDTTTCRVVRRNLDAFPQLCFTRDLTANRDVPMGWVLTARPITRFFLVFIENTGTSGMKIVAWCSSRVMEEMLHGGGADAKAPTTGSLDRDERGPTEGGAGSGAGAGKRVSLANIEANRSWGDFAVHEQSLGSMRPSPGSKQHRVLQGMVKTYRANLSDQRPGGTVILIVGGSRTGKTTVGGKMFAAEIGATLFDSFDFTDPGQWLGNVLSSYGPSPDKPVILQVDECDVLFKKINSPGKQPQPSSCNDAVRTQCTDKKSLNGFMDKVRDTPGLVLVLTSNISPETMLDAAIVHWSTVFRIHRIDFLNEPLENAVNAPEIDADLPGAARLRAAVAGESNDWMH